MILRCRKCRNASILGKGFQYFSVLQYFCTGFLKSNSNPTAMMTRQRDEILQTPQKQLHAATPDRETLPVPVTPPPDPPKKFYDLQVAPIELRPSAVLTTGQCFHWKSTASLQEPAEPQSAWGTHNATEWIGTLRTPDSSCLVVLLRETPSTVLFCTLSAPPQWTSDKVRSFLRDYFQLDLVSLSDLYRQWSTRCDRLRRIATAIPGLRLIDQDPFECLVSFLCSSNNNIPRITQMLQSIRREYGTAELEFQGEMLYSFPSLETLWEKATEKDLRSECRMGYRAKYLMKTMELLHELGGEPYLHTLRQNKTHEEVQTALLQFTGIGRKVADCVALFSLRAVEAVPVDVHVWNIARRDYGMDALTASPSTSLTPKNYRLVADRLREQFPEYGGWAHSLLFAAELPSFRERLPDDMLEEMQKFRETEKTRKRKNNESS